MFDGKTGFCDWIFKVKAAVKSENATLAGHLQELMHNPDEMIDEELLDENDRAIDAQLYLLLVEKTDGDALDVVKSPRGEGHRGVETPADPLRLPDLREADPADQGNHQPSQDQGAEDSRSDD